MEILFKGMKKLGHLSRPFPARTDLFLKNKFQLRPLCSGIHIIRVQDYYLEGGVHVANHA